MGPYTDITLVSVGVWKRHCNTDFMTQVFPKFFRPAPIPSITSSCNLVYSCSDLQFSGLSMQLLEARFPPSCTFFCNLVYSCFALTFSGLSMLILKARSLIEVKGQIGNVPVARRSLKKWIHQYGVAVLKISEICDFVESRSNIEQALLTSKRNWLVLFLEWKLLLWPSYASAIVSSRTRTRRTIFNFATFRFGTLPVCLTSTNGSASF